MIFSLSIYSQVEADFIVNGDISGCVGLQVEFVDVSHGNPTLWQWDFGNGVTSNIQNPIVTFIDPGVYTVRLYVSNNITGDMVTKDSYISVYDKPIVDFTSNTSLICASNMMNFVNQTNSVNSVDSFYWDFGDGYHSFNINPQHLYNDTGFFDVSLLAYVGGCVDSLVVDNFMKVLSPVVVFQDIHSCETPFEVEFNSNIVDADVWFWDFDDGNTSNQLSPVHTFLNRGDYQVSLTALNNASGCSTTVEKIVKIVKPVADFDLSSSTPFEGCPPLYVEWDDYSIDQWYDFLWYGDGDSTNWIYNHTYEEPGYYSVKQVIVDVHRCKDTLVIDSMIHVLEPPNINETEDITICLNDSAQINVTGDVGDFSWTPNLGLNDPNISNPVCHASDTTEYIISLFDGFCFNYDTMTVNIDKNLPLVDFFTDITCLGVPVQFYDNTIIYDDLVYYNWDFGNGVISDISNPVHLFNSQGEQIISLTVIYDSTGCKSHIVDTINIYNLPVANAGLDVVACEGDQVDLYADGGVSYDWGTGISYNPVYQVKADQTQFYSVIVYDVNGCSSSDDVGVFVTPRPIIEISEDVSICYGDSVLLDVSGGVYYNWNHGQYNTSEIHVSPSVSTNYYIEVTGINGCVSTDYVSVNVSEKITPDFNVKDVLCLQDSFEISNNMILEEAVYYWSFGDGNFSNIINPRHKFYNTGIYNIELYIESQGCVSYTSTQSVKVYDNPVADFYFNSNIISDINFNVVFDNFSTNSLFSLWDFGDNNYSNELDPSHLYSDTGVYEVSLLVWNEYGCQDNQTQLLNIEPHYSCYIPNSFTPNDDGINDYFVPRFNAVSSCVMRIYSKWGNLIFTTDDFDVGWNGRLSSGVMAESGIYIIELNTLDLNNKLRKYHQEINLIY